MNRGIVSWMTFEVGRVCVGSHWRVDSNSKASVGLSLDCALKTHELISFIMLFIYIQTGWAWTRIQISVTPKKVMRVGEPNKTGDGLARSTSNSWTVSLKVIQDSRFSEKTGSALKASSRPAQARRSGHTPRSSSISSIGNMRTSAIRAIRKILSHMSTISVRFVF